MLLLLAQHAFILAQKLVILDKPVFYAGEELTYKLKYGVLTAADGILKVKYTDQKFEGKPSFHLTAEGQTAGTFGFFYTVHNKYDSYIDQKTFLPYYYEEDIHEGKYRRNDKVKFDQSSRKVTGNKGTYNGAEQTFDLLSAYYFARQLNLSGIKEGDSFKFTYFLHDEVATLGITYIGKETIETKLGNIRCLKFSPDIKAGRIFKKSSKLYLWVTDDGNRIPVKAQVEIIVGSVTLELQNAIGLKYPIQTSK
ncbi:Protein of unknown function [bacterium A37T11]|nr:Protein of unknown function [bacterium A37T11]